MTNSALDSTIQFSTKQKIASNIFGKHSTATKSRRRRKKTFASVWVAFGIELKIERRESRDTDNATQTTIQFPLLKLHSLHWIWIGQFLIDFNSSRNFNLILACLRRSSIVDSIVSVGFYFRFNFCVHTHSYTMPNAKSNSSIGKHVFRFVAARITKQKKKFSRKLNFILDKNKQSSTIIVF